MSSSQRKAAEILREDFLRAYERWPGLHHEFIQVDIQAAYRETDELNLFTQSYPRTVVAPLLGERVVLDCTISLHDSLASEQLGFSVYSDDPPGDRAGLRTFKELALSACRCFFPKAVRQFSDAHGHTCFLPDMWLGVIYTLALDHRDPLLTVREHRLEVAKDGGEFRLVPGYSEAIPDGDAVGWGRKFRPWKDLMADLARFGVKVDLIEASVFRASAYVLEQIKSKIWRVDAGSRKSKRGRPHDARVAERNKAIVEEYKRDPNQTHQAIAVKIAPESPDLKCGFEQVRKAVRSYERTHKATGKK